MSAEFVDLEAAAAQVKAGQTLMVGGFGLIGQPVQLLEAIGRRQDLHSLTVISNNVGEPGRGLGLLLDRGMIDAAVGSFFTSNPVAVERYAAGDLDVTLLPQGTLSEAIRSGGAGIPAFYTPTSAGTELAEGYETREFDGKDHVLVHSLTADVALIRAHRSDSYGNLTYNATARNFNPPMATAAKTVIAQVDEIVDAHPCQEAIVTPHIFVDFIVAVP